MGNARQQKELRRKKRKERDAAKRAKPPKPRECGGCTACCTYQAIPEVESAAGEPCQHECEAGCAIYTARPSRCQGFACMWLGDWGKGFERPDKLGWFSFVDSHPAFNRAAGGTSTKGQILVVRETRSGAVHETRFIDALRDWLKLGSAVMVQTSIGTDAEQLTLYGPKIPKGVTMTRRELEKNPTEGSSPG